MKMLRCAILAIAVVSAVPIAHAQFVSVYGLFNPTHASNVQTGSTYSGGTYTNQTTGYWAPAFGGGVTLNFLNLHVVKLGLDLRGATKSGTTGLDTAQAGLRLGFQPPLLKLKPYVQAGVGYAHTRTVNVSTNSSGTGTVGGTFNNDFATFGVQGGIDKPLMPFLDFRVVEIGVSHGFNTGISSSSNNATLFSIATGLVAHF